MKKLKFNELPLTQEMLLAVQDMGFEEASPIQTEAIPYILEGRDVIGHSQTGTGKTAAFAIPIIQKISTEDRSIQAIVLCPTRELVIQTADEFRKLMKYTPNAVAVSIYGGQPIDRQFKILNKKPQVVIGTPGRTIDHINRGSIKLDGVRFVVLDEADEMLDMGFREDIELILKETRRERQTIMFSATMPPAMQKMMKQYQTDPVKIDVTHHKLESPKIEQVYFEMRESTKPEALTRLLDLHNIKSALVFCNTKLQVDSLVEILKARGYFADALHGDLAQKQRDKVMQSFRNGSVEILVATDVAGRGIDVNDIEAVFNYDLPQDDEDYIHRIGRTARAGKKGIAFTFIVGKQIYNLKRIEKSNGIKVARKQIPTIEDLDVTRMKSLGSDIQDTIEAGHLRKYIGMVEELLGDEYTAIDVAAALLKQALETKKDLYDDSVTFDEDYEAELHRRDSYGDKKGYKKGSKSFGGYDKSEKFGKGGGGRDKFAGQKKFEKEKKKKFAKAKFEKFEKKKK